MSFYEKLEILCKNQGITVTALANKLGYSSSAGTTWKKSKGLPRNSTIKKITDYFNVPITYFSDDTSVNSHNTINGNNNIIGNGNTVGEHLTEQENALLSIFNRIDVIKQAQLLAYAAELEKEV